MECISSGSAFLEIAMALSLICQATSNKSNGLITSSSDAIAICRAVLQRYKNFVVLIYLNVFMEIISTKNDFVQVDSK